MQPKWHFWIGLVIFIAGNIASGTIHLTNMVPDDSIRYITAWAAFIRLIGEGYIMAALGWTTGVIGNGKNA